MNRAFLALVLSCASLFWPASAEEVPPPKSAQLYQHLAMADVLVENARRPEAQQGVPAVRDSRKGLEDLRRHQLFLARLAEAEHHLTAAWALRAFLPEKPEDAFGTDGYSSASGSTPRISETARDVFSYQAARILASTGSWRGVDSLAPAPASVLLSPPPVDPGDATVHPLVRAGAVLRDLEMWHLENGRREAALRAARSFFSMICESGPYNDRPAFRAAFEARLRRDQDLSGFSLGLHDLALIVWNQDYHLLPSRNRARALAREGREAHPDSEGALLCDAFLSRPGRLLELTGMSHDGPGKRSLRLRSRGIGEVTFFAVRIDPLANLPLLARTHQPEEILRRLLRESDVYRSWSVRPELPGDDEPHTTWITPPLDEKGAYVIVASSVPSLQAREGLVAATTLVITGLVLVTRSEPRERSDVLVVSGEKGEPQPGVTVRRVTMNGEPLVSLTTDQSGRASLPPPPAATETLIVATRGKDFAASSPSYGPMTDDAEAALLIMDKNRYHPGERVHFFYLRTIRQPGDSRVVPAAGKQIAITLLDATGRPLRRLRPTTNDFGAAWGALTIPPDRPAGVWRIQEEADTTPDGQDRRGRASAEFEVVNDGFLNIEIAPVPELPPDEGLVSVLGSVTGPEPATVRAAKISWGLRTSGMLIDQGETGVEHDGHFSIQYRLPAALPSRAATLETTVTSGPYRFRAFRELHRAQGSLTISTRWRSWFRAEETVVLTLERGRGETPAPGTSRYRLLRLSPPTQALLPGDLEQDPADGLTAADRRFARSMKATYPSFWSAGLTVDSEVVSGTCIHGPDGLSSLALGRLSPGLYQFEQETTDEEAEAGEAIRSSSRFIVLSRTGTVPFGTPWLLSPPADTGVLHAPWQVLVHCGFPGQLFFKEHHRNGRLVSRTSHRKSHISRIPTGPGQAGRHELHLFFVRDYRLVYAESPWNLSGRENGLRLSAETRPNGLLVRIRGPKGERPGPGNVEVLAMFAPPGGGDRDVYVQSPDPYVLEPRETGPGALLSSLSEVAGLPLAFGKQPSQRTVTPAQPGHLKRLKGFAVRDAVPSEALETENPPGLSVPPLPEFDSLTFQPHLQPDAEGEILIKLPSALPSEKVWILAMTTDMKFGFAEVSLAKKPEPSAVRRKRR